MSKTAYIILWTITAINVVIIGYFQTKQPTEQCYPLNGNASVCVKK